MTLREIFEGIDPATIEEWVTSRRQEDLHLDFKTVSGAGSLNKDDKRNLARAVSGFGNSDGGLIVWGVSTEKDPSGIDAASDLRLVENPAAALSRLQSITGEAATPIVDGIEHRIIHFEGGGGVLITLIPASDLGPHMAMLGEGRYYKRSGDSFYPMEHFDIADMFGRRAHADLTVTLQADIGSRSGGPNGRSASAEPIIWLANSGRGIAKFPLVRVGVSEPYRVTRFGLDGNGRTGLPERVEVPSNSGWRVYAGGANDVIHPGTSLAVTRVKYEVLEGMAELPDLVVTFETACEGVHQRAGRASLSGRELLAMARDAIEESFSRKPRESG